MPLHVCIATQLWELSVSAWMLLRLHTACHTTKPPLRFRPQEADSDGIYVVPASLKQSLSTVMDLWHLDISWNRQPARKFHLYVKNRARDCFTLPVNYDALRFCSI